MARSNTPSKRAQNATQKPTVSSRPLWQTAWRRILRRPTQYILLVIGVALGVAMMVSVDLANGSANRAFRLSTDAVAGKTTHRIVGGPAGLDEDLYRRLRTELGYAPAAPVVEDYLLVEEMGNQPKRLVGVDPFAEPPFRSFFGVEQTVFVEALTSFLTTPNTVLISEDLAGRHGLALGDTLTLSRAGRPFSMRISGLLRPTDEASRQAMNGLVFADISTAQVLLDMVGRLHHVDLIVEETESLTEINAILPPGAQIETAAARSNTVQQMAAAFQLNLTALSLLALIVGMFLIYNTVTFSVVQRRRLFGILRSLGVTGGQLFGLILAETALLGLLGALLGLGAGLLLGRGMIRLVSQTINDFYFVVDVQSVSVPAVTLLKALGVGVASAITAAIVPAWEAMRTTPQSGLHRSSLESSARRAIRWLLLAFVALAGLGVLLLWLRGVGLFVSFVGLFAILIACAFLTPGLTSALMDRLQPLSARLFGAIGRMAPRDISRSLSRTSIAIAALMVAVSVIVGVSIMIGSFRQTVDRWLSSTLRADIYLSPPALTGGRIEGTLDPEVVASAERWPGVERVVTAWQNEILAPDIGRPIEVTAVSGDVSDGKRDYAWIDGDRDDLWRRIGNGEGVIVSEPLVLREALGIPPPPLTLMTEQGPRDFPVLAVFYDYSSDRGSVLIATEEFEKWWGPAEVTSVGLFLAPGEDANDLAAALQAFLSGRDDVVVQSNRAVRANALDIFDRTFAITAALQLLAVVVAFIGVLSALMSMQLERSRELGMLRATGMTISQLWQLTLLETGLMGGTAGLLAMPVGWILAWILIFIINRRSFGWTLQMDLEPSYFLQAFAVAVVAALLAGIYPSLRLSRMVIADAVREE